MIDIHSHVWPAQFIEDSFLEDASRIKGGEVNIQVDCADHERDILAQVDKAIVLGFRAPASGIDVPNEYVAEYRDKHSDKIIAFGSVDPNQSEALKELKYTIEKLNMKGLKLGPIYQHFNPQDKTIAYPLYDYMQSRGLPILWHMGTSFPEEGQIEYTRPILLDRVAQDFPDLKMVIAHLGHPWFGEAVSVIRKRPNVYGDATNIFCRPWQFYNAMLMAQEYGIMGKIFFGSDYPCGVKDFNEAVKLFKAVNQFTPGSNLPEVDETLMDEILNRNPLEKLGIE